MKYLGIYSLQIICLILIQTIILKILLLHDSLKWSCTPLPASTAKSVHYSVLFLSSLYNFTSLACCASTDASLTIQLQVYFTIFLVIAQRLGCSLLRLWLLTCGTQFCMRTPIEH